MTSFIQIETYVVLLYHERKVKLVIVGCRCSPEARRRDGRHHVLDLILWNSKKKPSSTSTLWRSRVIHRTRPRTWWRRFHVESSGQPRSRLFRIVRVHRESWSEVKRGRPGRRKRGNAKCETVYGKKIKQSKQSNQSLIVSAYWAKSTSSLTFIS